MSTLFYCVTVVAFYLLWKSIDYTSLENNQLKQTPSSPWISMTGGYATASRPRRITRKRHGYFLHITDMHVDDDYIGGATIKSDCRKLPSLAEKMKSVETAGKWGTPGAHCDAPVGLAQETLNWIVREWRSKLDFVVWTGDNARHDWDKKHKRKRRNVYELNQRVTDMMMEAFWPRDSDDVVPVIPSFGNNDVYPHNQIGDAHSDGDMLSFYEQLWRPWIPVNQRHTFRQGGYFVVPVGPRLSVLTLNSLYFYKKNKAVHNCHKDNSPGAIQLAWFENQLKKARSEKERIYVIGHVPPSPRDYKGTCLAEYMRVASSYNDVIMGQFFAHLNMDHFMLFDGRQSMQTLQDSAEDDLDIQEDDVHATRNIEAYMGWLRNMYEEIDPLDDKRAPPNTKPPIVAVQVAPSVLPVYFPGLRIYKYEINESEEETDDEEERKPHGTLLGYEQYFSNLTKWNELDSDHIEYELEYSTEEEYEMEDLSVESYFELAKRMVEGDQGGNELWSMFQRHMLVSTQNFTSNPFAQ